MASINKRQRKAGTRWRVMWRLDDGEQRSRTFDSYDEARRFKTEVEALEQAGRAPDPQKGAQTLSEWSEAFMATLHLKPQTEANYRSLLRSRILPTFGKSRLDAITRLQVQQWVSGMAKEISAKRTTAAYRLLHQILSEAVKHDVMLKNPASDIKLPRVAKQDVPVLTFDELRTVAGFCGRYEPLVMFLGVMGVRWAEAIGMTPGQIKGGVVTIDRSLSEVSGKFHEVTPKTWEIRRLPIPESLSKTLPSGSQTVFTTTHGNPVRSGHFRDSVFKPALKKAVVQEIRIHDLRHTSASILIQKGASIKGVQAWLGHADVRITLDNYSHLFPNDLDEIAKKMDELF